MRLGRASKAGSPLTPRQRIIQAALSHLGEGPLQEYQEKAWCGQFVLKCYHEAEIALSVSWPWGCSLCHVIGTRTRTPQQADFGIQDRSPWHHILFVRDGVTVAGNTGPSPGCVALGGMPSSGYVWYSISALVEAARPMPLTVRLGSRGETVKRWQVVLGFKPDGVFGPRTDTSTRAWQAAHGLKPDGIVGPKTWAAALA